MWFKLIFNLNLVLTKPWISNFHHKICSTSCHFFLNKVHRLPVAYTIKGFSRIPLLTHYPHSTHCKESHGFNLQLANGTHLFSGIFLSILAKSTHTPPPPTRGQIPQTTRVTLMNYKPLFDLTLVCLLPSLPTTLQLLPASLRSFTLGNNVHEWIYMEVQTYELVFQSARHFKL